MRLDQHHLKLLGKKWARYIHMYLSLFGLVLLLFFAVTGFMLNNPDWFGIEETQTRTSSITLPPALVASGDKLALVEKLRKDAGVTGFLDSIDTSDAKSLYLSFKSPGQKFDVQVAKATGETSVSHEWHGFLGRITELHRGNDTGTAWKLVIDATALLLITSILTGVTLWLMVPRWRTYGLAAIALCATTCALIYYFTVS